MYKNYNMKQVVLSLDLESELEEKCRKLRDEFDNEIKRPLSKNRCRRDYPDLTRGKWVKK